MVFSHATMSLSTSWSASPTKVHDDDGARAGERKPAERSAGGGETAVSAMGRVEVQARGSWDVGGATEKRVAAGVSPLAKRATWGLAGAEDVVRSKRN